MTEQHPLDVSILHEAEESRQHHEIAFGNAYIAMMTALELAAREHLRANETPPDVAAHYDRAVGAFLITLKHVFDSHLARMNASAMFPQLVKLITEEVIAHVVRHNEEIQRLQMVVDQQQRYINEIKREREP